MSQPNRVLLWMIGFLILIGLAAAALFPSLRAAFGATPVFNGVILLVFATGIVVNLRQVLRLQKEVEWIENLRRSDPDRKLEVPVLLAPMAKMFGKNERKPQSLSTASMRSLLDSVYLRLEEQRDLSRYLIGLLIFLGLLGTFWGLLRTIGSVGEIIGGLDAGTDPVAMFAALKSRLQAPLAGMATSFSTSLFGLAGSLVLGFLDLQAGRAANRFYTELEDWLSGMTKLSSGGMAGEGDASVPSYVQALLEQTADGLERLQRAIVDSERERRGGTEQMAELNRQLARLTEHLGSSGASNTMNDELRQELRLMSRTIAAALDGNKRHAVER
jgi:hypothetical protein